MSLPTLYQDFIHLSRYSRWMEDENRRETWEETVTRYFNYFNKQLDDVCNYKLSEEDRNTLQQSVIDLKVMPSMRALMTAGDALDRDK